VLCVEADANSVLFVAETDYFGQFINSRADGITLASHVFKKHGHIADVFQGLVDGAGDLFHGALMA
jgi:hypothetical protein